MWGKKNREPQDRRRAPRKPVTWRGKCWVDRGSEQHRCSCQVVNVSRVGAALALEEDLELRQGDRMILDIEQIGPTAVLLRLGGTVRTVHPRDDGAAVPVVGVDLRFDNPSAQQIAKTLFSDPA